MPDQFWPVTGLGEIFTINTDGVAPTASPSTEFHHHSLPAWDMLGGPAVEKGSLIESNKTKLAKPCVLVSKLNPRKPRVSVVGVVPNEEHHCASTEFVCLEPRHEECLSFWGHLFANKSFSDNLDRIAIGSTNSHKRYSPKALLSQRIELPPVPERKIIARILDTLDTQIEKTEALIAKLEKVKEGLLHDLLTRGIDENGQLRPSPDQVPELYKESPLGLIPKEWSAVGFLDAVELPSGQISPLIEPYASLPLIAPDHIEASTSRLIKTETARDQNAISGKYFVRPGDVVYSKIRPYLRKAWLSNINSICSADMYPLKPRLLTSELLLRIVMSEEFSTYANAASMRTGIPKINRDEIAGYKFALPTRQEQVRVERVFKEIEKKSDKEREILRKLISAKHGLMDDLLTGRVRVTPLLEQQKEVISA